ncbi:MAG: SMI1/KNR4 family protein [Alphaproteobacteria bacterium]
MSKNNIWGLLAEHAKEFPEDFAEGVKLEEIREAEAELGLKFSEAYIRFLQTYGGACFCAYPIYGLRKLEIMGNFCWSIVNRTLHYRSENWPDIEDWYIVLDDGRGNPIGVDPDGKVWLSDHDSGFEQVLLAEDFEEFLYKLYTETLYE